MLVSLHVLVEAGTAVRGNDELERNILVVETVAVSKGLPPEVITVLLDLALSLNAGNFIYSGHGRLHQMYSVLLIYKHLGY